MVERTVSGLLDRWLGREENVISVCCMKNDAGDVESDADGMKNIWRKYMEKLLNVENDWNCEVDCPEVMGPHCLISEVEVFFLSCRYTNPIHCLTHSFATSL